MNATPSGDTPSSAGPQSGAPYYGGGQLAGGPQSNVEEQLARTWSQWRQDWYDWTEPARNILYGIGQATIDALSPHGWDVVVPVIEGAPPAARAIITARQQQRVQEAIGNGDDPNGKQTDQQLEELRRLQEMTNKALNP